jgi:hypothetical protein
MNVETVGLHGLAMVVVTPLLAFGNLGLREARATDVRQDYPFGHYLTLRSLRNIVALLAIALVAWAMGLGPMGYRGRAHCFFLGREVLTLLYTPEYADYADLLLLATTAALFRQVATMWQSGTIAARRFRLHLLQSVLVVLSRVSDMRQHHFLRISHEFYKIYCFGVKAVLGKKLGRSAKRRTADMKVGFGRHFLRWYFFYAI